MKGIPVLCGGGMKITPALFGWDESNSSPLWDGMKVTPVLYGMG